MREILVNQLKEQHRKIESYLKEIDIELEKSDSDIEMIFKSITNFQAVFSEHLELENNQFYKELLDALIKEDEDIHDIKDFINQMDFIVTRVHSFLDFYDSVEKIEKSEKLIFQTEFVKMRTDLEIRINVEELFVYKRMLSL